MINVNALGNRAKSALRRTLPDDAIDGIARLFAVRFLRQWLSYAVNLKPNLTRQLSYRIPGSAETAPSGPRVLVPLIETTHYQFFQVLIVAKALQIRGAKVKVLLCGQSLDGCEIKNVRNSRNIDPCFTCRFNERRILPLFGLETARLSDFVGDSERAAMAAEARDICRQYPEKLLRAGVDLIPMVEDSVTRYYYGAVPDDPDAVGRVRAKHLSTALMNLEIARRLGETWKPDVVFSNMLSYSAWEPYFRIFRKKGIPFCSISIMAFDYHKVRINQYDLFMSTDRFTRYLESRHGRPLDAAEKGALDRFMAQRFAGNSATFVDSAYFRHQVADEIKGRLRFDPNKRNLFLFSNLYWDVGLSLAGGLFTGVIDWVLESIEAVRGHPECHLYIKPHPAEVYGSAKSMKGVAQIIRERYPVLPPNVSIIDPSWKLNTYELFPLIDAGIVFTGTLGLEMMLSGIPVVSTGSTSHHGLGFAQEPKSLEAYREALLGRAAPPAVDREKLEMFAYFYFIRTLIPWKLTQSAWANADFDGYRIESLEDLEPGSDPHLDHLCDFILDPRNTVIDAWPDEASAPVPVTRSSRAVQ